MVKTREGGTSTCYPIMLTPSRPRPVFPAAERRLRSFIESNVMMSCHKVTGIWFFLHKFPFVNNVNG